MTSKHQVIQMMFVEEVREQKISCKNPVGSNTNGQSIFATLSHAYRQCDVILPIPRKKFRVSKLKIDLNIHKNHINAGEPWIQLSLDIHLNSTHFWLQPRPLSCWSFGIN